MPSWFFQQLSNNLNSILPNIHESKGNRIINPKYSLTSTCHNSACFIYYLLSPYCPLLKYSKVNLRHNIMSHVNTSYLLLIRTFQSATNTPINIDQSCPTLCNPMDCSPIRLLCRWDSQGKQGLNWFLLERMCSKKVFRQVI